MTMSARLIFRTFDDAGRFIPTDSAHALSAHARALELRAAQLEEESGRAAHRRLMARNSYTIYPVYRPDARDARADRMRAKARAIRERVEALPIFC